MAVDAVHVAGARPCRHSALEDAQALLTGTLFVALGLVLYRHVGLVTGGTAGLAFIITVERRVGEECHSK
jgi:hypothetical protein